MSSEKQSASNPLEQFIILAKSTKGAGAVELVKQCLEAPGVYVFGELLDMPNIQELSTGTTAPYFQLLNLFAYGIYSDYKANEGNYPELSQTMLTKLKHLTIVTLATKSKCIPYSVLLKELDIKNLRQLEDLIIEVIYADIIHGKLDQKNQQLEVDYAIGRDIQPEAMNEMLNVLQQWCTSCESTLSGIQAQIQKANDNKDKNHTIQNQIDNEVSNIKKTLKATQQDTDEQMITDVPTQSEKPVKKASKTKGLRGSGKFWSKSST